MVHRNLPARRPDIFRPHLQIEPKTTAYCTTQGFECPPNLYAMQLLKQSPLERDVNQTDEPSRWWAAHITTIYAYAHADPRSLSGSTTISIRTHAWQHIKITQNSHLALYSRQDECVQDMFTLAKPDIFPTRYPDSRSVENLYLPVRRTRRALYSRALTHCLGNFLNFQFLLVTMKAVVDIRQREIRTNILQGPSRYLSFNRDLVT